MNYIQTVIQKKKKTELMRKTLQAGFSFIELIVVFALIALLGAFVVPNLFRTKQGAQRKEFLASFESLLKDAVRRSIIENEMHQIFIDIDHEVIQTRIYDLQSIETNEHKKFIRLIDSDYLTEVAFPKRFKMHNFFINGIEELISGTMTLDVFFYIMPDGTSQGIIANCVDRDEEGVAPDVNFSFVINPFYARISVHEAFQTP